MKKSQIYYNVALPTVVGTFTSLILFCGIWYGWTTCLWPDWLELASVPVAFALIPLFIIGIINLIKYNKVNPKRYKAIVTGSYCKPFNWRNPFEYKQHCVHLKKKDKKITAICPWQLPKGTRCYFSKVNDKYIVTGIIYDTEQSETEAINNT